MAIKIDNEYYREYRKRNKESVRASQVKWIKKNPTFVMFHSAKARAKKKGLEFTITKEDIVIPEYCPILKMKLIPSVDTGYSQCGPSIDRIDPTKGYTKENIQVISIFANTMKQNATIEQLKLFEEWTRTL